MATSSLVPTNSLIRQQRCVTCGNPFTHNIPLFWVTLESIQQTANTSGCEECQLLLKGIEVVFEEENKNFLSSGVRLSMRNSKTVTVTWDETKPEKKGLEFWCPAGICNALL